MKRVFLFSILLSLVFAPITFAVDTQESTNEPESNISVQAPKWEEYVPDKYRNPRTDFSRGKSIAELSVGIALTDLLITAPIGIPMICHSSTKLKNLSYADKKIIFEEGLLEAEKITNPQEKQLYYNKLLRKCKFSEKTRQKQLQKKAKAAKKQNKNN